METKLFIEIESILNMFVVGRIFKVSELFDPVVWENKTISEKLKIAEEFQKLLLSELKNIVELIEDNENGVLKLYKKTGTGLLKTATNVFPDKPVTIKRNERGNA